MTLSKNSIIKLIACSCIVVAIMCVCSLLVWHSASAEEAVPASENVTDVANEATPINENYTKDINFVVPRQPNIGETVGEYKAYVKPFLINDELEFNKTVETDGKPGEYFDLLIEEATGERQFFPPLDDSYTFIEGKVYSVDFLLQCKDGSNFEKPKVGANSVYFGYVGTCTINLASVETRMGSTATNQVNYDSQKGYSFNGNHSRNYDPTLLCAFTITPGGQGGSSVEAITATAPTKTTYAVGEKFDPTGMQITASFADGTSKELSTDECSYSPSEFTTPGEQNVTVSYTDSAGKTVTTNVGVNVTSVGENVTSESASNPVSSAKTSDSPIAIVALFVAALACMVMPISLRKM